MIALCHMTDFLAVLVGSLHERYAKRVDTLQ